MLGEITKCSKCGAEFVRTQKLRAVCRPCLALYQREYMRKYREKNAEFENERYRQRLLDPEFVAAKRKRGRQYWADLRHAAMVTYGGYRCACCGEAEPKFLTLDHVFNDGGAHRKEIGGNGKGSAIFKWLRDHGYPAGFQVLCMNCNHGKALNGGVCPHKTTTTRLATSS